MPSRCCTRGFSAQPQLLLSSASHSARSRYVCERLCLRPLQQRQEVATLSHRLEQMDLAIELWSRVRWAALPIRLSTGS